MSHGQWPVSWRVFVATQRDAPEPAAVRTMGASLFGVSVERTSASVDGAFVVTVLEGEALTVVHGLSVAKEHAGDDWALAERAVTAMGGAGMDVLVARASRVWRLSVERDDRHARRGVAIVAGVLAQSELGPALLPDGTKLVGIRGVRQWIDLIA